MNRGTILRCVGLLLLCSLTLMGCKRHAPTAPVTQSAQPAQPTAGRVTMMPEGSGELTRVYGQQPDGTTKVAISFADGSTGEIVARGDGNGKFVLLSGWEAHGDGSKVVYEYTTASTEPTRTCYFRADGTTYVVREVLDASVKHTFFADDGKTIFRLHEEHFNGRLTDVIHRPNGTALVDMESWHKTSTRITLFDDAGKKEYNEYAFFGGDRSLTTITIDWYQSGVRRASEKWHTDAEGEVVDSRSMFNAAGKEVLVLKPTAEFAGSRAVQRWTATRIDEASGQTSVGEITDLEFVQYPEEEVAQAKEGARHVFEEYTGLMIEAEDHKSSFKNF